MCFGGIQHIVASYMKKLQEMLEYEYEDFESLHNVRNRLMS